jgi:hypothetical protein
VIVLTLLLVLASLALLATGLIADALPYILASIGASLLGGIFLVLGVRQRRGPLPDGPAGTASVGGMTTATGASATLVSESAGVAGATRPDTSYERDTAERGRPADEPYPPLDEPAEEPVSDSDALRVAGLSADVMVIDGRPRYHLPGCPHLLGRVAQPLPVSEARDLGFTPCALCRPDSNLLTTTA